MKPERKYQEPSIATVIAIFIALVFAVMWLDDIDKRETAPIEDVTGLCVRPTPQGGC